jgi:hypothetical protein
MRERVSLPLSEDGNISSFRSVVFSRYLEFRTVYKGRKLFIPFLDTAIMLYCRPALAGS